MNVCYKKCIDIKRILDALCVYNIGHMCYLGLVFSAVDIYYKHKAKFSVIFLHGYM